jgi:hypothetical protein
VSKGNRERSDTVDEEEERNESSSAVAKGGRAEQYPAGFVPPYRGEMFPGPGGPHSWGPLPQQQPDFIPSYDIYRPQGMQINPQTWGPRLGGYPGGGGYFDGMSMRHHPMNMGGGMPMLQMSGVGNFGVPVAQGPGPLYKNTGNIGASVQVKK